MHAEEGERGDRHLPAVRRGSASAAAKPEPNQLTVRIEPEPGARIRLFAKKAGEEAFEPADLAVLFEKKPGEDPEPYERLLGDALVGSYTLFTRQDAVEETWRMVRAAARRARPGAPLSTGNLGPQAGRQADPRPLPVVRALASQELAASSGRREGA